METADTCASPAPALTGSRRELLIGAAFALAAVTAFVRQPRQHVASSQPEDIAHLVPQSFAGWSFVTASGLVLPPSDQLRDEIYSQLLTRTYAHKSGMQVMLLIAYNPLQDGLVQIHRPEVCYPASGYHLTENRRHITQLAPGVAIPSRNITAESPSRRERILYWTRTGKDFPRSWSEQRLAIFEQNLHGLIPDGLLLRISSTDDNADFAALDKFAVDMYSSLGHAMRRILAWA